MKFHEWETMYRQAVRFNVNIGLDDEKSWTLKRFKENDAGGRAENRYAKFDAMFFGSEYYWMNARRPYFSVFPSICEALMRVTLDLDSSLIVPPIGNLLIRFPVGQEPVVTGDYCRSILVCYCRAEYDKDEKTAIAISGQWGDVNHETAMRPQQCGIPIEKGKTVDEVVAHEWSNKSPRSEAMARIVCAVCLMASDPDLVIPDVLSGDRRAYEETGDQKYVDRAHRRGKVGWTVGANIEVDPHFRRPHFGIRWTGKGGEVPKIVPIKGAVVHRRKLTEVPTGYMDDE